MQDLECTYRYIIWVSLGAESWRQYLRRDGRAGRGHAICVSQDLRDPRNYSG